MAWKLPEKKSEAYRMVWMTVKAFRQQLNDSLGCNIKQNEFNVVVKIVMDEYDRLKKSK